MSSLDASPNAAKALRRLRDVLPGRVILPGDTDWDVARSAWDLNVDQCPAAVVAARQPDDVVKAVRAAAAAGLRVTAQSTGHAAGSLPDLADTILVRTSRLAGVEVDAEARRARVGAGAHLRQVIEPAAKAGLAPLAGTSPAVGVAGHTVAGGLGWLGRRYGLAADSVISLEVVTADGRLRTIDRERDPDLFWALRGGGGSFGVVTALEFCLYGVSRLYAGWLAWPWQRAHDVLHAWLDWRSRVPEEVTSTVRLLRVPPLTELPADLRGPNLIVIDAAIFRDETAGAEMIRDLRSLRPAVDTFTPAGPAALGRMHQDPEQPTPQLLGARLLDEVSHATIDAVLAEAGPGSGSPLAVLELRHLGGALARRGRGSGALAALDASDALLCGGVASDTHLTEAINSRTRSVFDAVREWDTGRRYAGFAESHPVDASMFFPDAVYRRLRRIKADVDPADLILGNHPVPPAMAS
jgi:hypothetical protein